MAIYFLWSGKRGFTQESRNSRQSPSRMKKRSVPGVHMADSFFIRELSACVFFAASMSVSKESEPLSLYAICSSIVASLSRA
jgi:hypothetical protein